MPDTPPSTNGTQTADGRDPRGRFAKGNKGGPGNPFAADVGRHRARLMEAIKDKDIDKAIKTILEVMGKGKDADRLAAARELLNRAVGTPVPSDILQRLEAIEKALAERQADDNIF